MRRADDAERFAHLQDVGVVGDERRGRAEVDDAFRGWRLETVGVDVRHHVVPDLALAALGVVVVDVVGVRLQLGDLRVGDRQPELLLRLGERNPELPPRPELEVGGEEVRHLLRGVPLGERVLCGVARHGSNYTALTLPHRPATLPSHMQPAVSTRDSAPRHASDPPHRGDAGGASDPRRHRLALRHRPRDSELQQSRKRVEALHAEIRQLEKENARLRAEIDSVKKSTYAVERIAREDLGMSKRGEVIYLLPANSEPHQLRVLGDELFRADAAVEVDGELGVGAGAFHRQDRAVAELFVADALAALERRAGALGGAAGRSAAGSSCTGDSLKNDSTPLTESFLRGGGGAGAGDAMRGGGEPDANTTTAARGAARRSSGRCSDRPAASAARATTAPPARSARGPCALPRARSPESR